MKKYHEIVLVTQEKINESLEAVQLIVSVCNRCGAIVIFESMHDQFHSLTNTAIK